MHNKIIMVIVSLVLVAASVIGAVFVFGGNTDTPPTETTAIQATTNGGLHFDHITGDAVIDFDDGNEKYLDTSLRNSFPETKIYNVYGLTEASPRACYLPPEEFDLNPLSVGIPLASLEAKIEDNELLLKGGSIMKGYYNDPDSTVKAIRNSWLCTGDIAERDGSGRVYIKCRRDNMIIRSGMNIYPQEIENSLKQDEQIRDVLAFGVKNETVGERIHIKTVTPLSKSEVFAVCRNCLPSYQLPDVIDIVDKIPKNASGKVIRNAKRNRN